MTREEEAKFMQTFRRSRFYEDYHNRDCDKCHTNDKPDYNRDQPRTYSDEKPDIQKQLSEFIKSQHSINTFVKNTFNELKDKLETTTRNHQASIQNLEEKFD